MRGTTVPLILFTSWASSLQKRLQKEKEKLSLSEKTQLSYFPQEHFHSF